MLTLSEQDVRVQQHRCEKVRPRSTSFVDPEVCLTLSVLVVPSCLSPQTSFKFRSSHTIVRLTCYIITAASLLNRLKCRDIENGACFTGGIRDFSFWRESDLSLLDVRRKGLG
jgi:hypothetical protein